MIGTSTGPDKQFKITGSALGATGNAYVDGGLIGKLQFLQNVVLKSKGFATLMSIIMQDLTNQKSKIEVIFFDAEPTGTTFTDDTALDIADADLPKIVGTVIIGAGDYQSYADNAVSTTANLGLILKSDSAKDLWCCFVSRGTPTYVADELSSVISFYQDA